MRVIVASTIAPFIRGGGRMIVEDLVRALADRDHDVESIELPFWSDPESIVEQMLALRLFDVSDACDRLITIRTPSQLLRHPNKVCWFIHHERAVYDLWGTRYQGFPSTAEGVRVRNAIIAADNEALREMRKVFTNSKIVRDRVRRYNGLDAEVIYPPLGDTRGYSAGSYGDYVFYPSRLAPIKRQDLLIQAMAHTMTDVRLIVAGAPDVGRDEADRLRALIGRLRVEDKVELIPEWISHERKQELFANALAGAYVPFDEDSYGYPSLESFQSRKPVLTCSDSGGTLELILDRVNGRVVDPSPAAIAAAMDELFLDRSRAQEWGEQGFETMKRLNIDWDHVVERFLS
jgi:glycosyltransferase involved in cell wall biosynthesis